MTYFRVRCLITVNDSILFIFSLKMSEDQLVEVDGLKYIENILNLFDAFMNNI